MTDVLVTEKHLLTVTEEITTVLETAGATVFATDESVSVLETEPVTVFHSETGPQGARGPLAVYPETEDLTFTNDGVHITTAVSASNTRVITRLPDGRTDFYTDSLTGKTTTFTYDPVSKLPVTIQVTDTP